MHKDMPPKLKLDQTERESTKEKEKIMDITQLTMQDTKRYIETHLASLMNIDLFLKEWVKIKKNDITSLICKAQLHLKIAQFNNIQYLMDAYAECCFSLGKP